MTGTPGFKMLFMNKTRLVTAVALGLIAVAHGQLGHELDHDVRSSKHNSGDGFHGLRPGPGLDMNTAIYYRTVHGILAALSIAVFFPLGSILMRLTPGRAAIWVHAIFQIVATLVFIVAAGLGIYLVRHITVGRNGNPSSFMAHPRTSLHPIMGIVTLVTLLPQPLLGYLHHKKFKQVQRRNFWSYMHVINGRITVTVGIANGFMGLNMAQAPGYVKKAYIIIAAIFWGIWALIAVWSELRRIRQRRRTDRAVKRRFEMGTRNLKSQPSSESSQ